MAKKPPFTKGRPVCIFCGGRPLTKEHIFAEWLHPYLPKTGEVNHSARFVVMERDRDLVTDKLQSGEGHSGRIRVVCDKCNGGWMSLLQQAAKPYLLPMVLGKRIPLFTRQQSVIAAWATMFTMVVEHRLRDNRLVATSQSERTCFMESRLAPKTWKVWIGRFERGSWNPIVTHSVAEVASDTSDSVRAPAAGIAVTPNTHATTFVVGKLMFHVFGSSFRRVVASQELPPELMPRIWPLRSSPVLFPPNLILSDIDADEVAFAFQRRLNRIRDAALKA